MAKKREQNQDSPSQEYQNFEELARKIMQVPKEEIDKLEEGERRKNSGTVAGNSENEGPL